MMKKNDMVNSSLNSQDSYKKRIQEENQLNLKKLKSTKYFE